MAKALGGGQHASTEGAAFNAYQYASCEDILQLGDHTIRLNRTVSKKLIQLLDIREHDGRMFAADLKENAAALLEQDGRGSHHER